MYKHLLDLYQYHLFFLMRPMIRKENANRSLLNETANLTHATCRILMSKLRLLRCIGALPAPHGDLAQESREGSPHPIDAAD